MVLLHATCVALDGAGVLIRGPSGAGKSDLALRLIDGGGVLVADDYCEVTEGRAGLTARAPATIAGKLEVRGYGIVALAFRAETSVALVVDLMPGDAIPRLPEATTCSIAGVSVPWMALDPFTASAPARLRLAMSHVAPAALRAGERT